PSCHLLHAHPFPTRRSSDLSGVAVKVVYLFKKIHVHHYEDKISMICAVNFMAVLALVVSQYLPSLGRENFFQITPIPGTGQNVRDRKSTRLKLQSRGHLVCR